MDVLIYVYIKNYILGPATDYVINIPVPSMETSFLVVG